MIISCFSSVLLAGGAYFSPHLGRLAQQRRLKRRCQLSRSLVLTYDDGPGACLTPRLLDLLRAYEAHATFFLLGCRAIANPGHVDRMVAAGHEVGCHSYAHLNAWKSWPWNAVRDISKGYETLARWVPPDGLFRPPYGKNSAATWLALRHRGAVSAWWTIDCRDTMQTALSPQAAVEAAARNGGGVVLMHDFDRTAEQSERVIVTSEQLLQYAKRENLAVKRLGDVLKQRLGMPQTSCIGCDTR